MAAHTQLYMRGSFYCNLETLSKHFLTACIGENDLKTFKTLNVLSFQKCYNYVNFLLV